jgi:hexulose-6-phosphate isomerase
VILGIMQGRLLPPEGNTIQAFPRARWAEEPALAAQVGLSTIEWIWDSWGLEVNPLGSDEGISRIQALARASGIEVRSVCADYFMDQTLVRAGSERSSRLAHLLALIARAARLGARRVVLPFVDSSEIRTTEEEAEVAGLVLEAAVEAERHGVELHLETSLSPEAFRRLLDRADHPAIRVNYDAGNSASLGYRPEEELDAYGHRLGSVHVKDRKLRGGTVPLGLGDADLPGLFRRLRRLRYEGDFILQVARGRAGEEVAWARANRARVERLWDEAQREEQRWISA